MARLAELATRPAVLIGLLLLACCAAPPPYDAEMDSDITALQQTIDTELVTLISLDNEIAYLRRESAAGAQKTLKDLQAKASYAENIGFYDKVDTELTALELRVDAAPNWATRHLDDSIHQIRRLMLGNSPAGFAPPTANQADPSALSMRHVHQQLDILSVPYLVSRRGEVNLVIQALLRYDLQLKNGNSSAT